MTHGARTFPYRIQPKYPGLRPEDRRIWESFIGQNPDRFNFVLYNVHVGDPSDCPEEIGDQARRSWHELTRWKIDVLAADDNAWYVIEVKPNANAKAIGQALSYRTLLPEAMSVSGKIVPVVLTDTSPPSTHKAGNALGVHIWETQ